MSRIIWILLFTAPPVFAGNTLVYWQPNNEPAMSREGPLLKGIVERHSEIFGVNPGDQVMLPINASLESFTAEVDRALQNARTGEMVFLDITSHGNFDVISTTTPAGKIPLETIASMINTAMAKFPGRTVNIIYNACSSGTLQKPFEGKTWNKGVVNLIMATTEEGDGYSERLHRSIGGAADDLRDFERGGNHFCKNCTPFERIMKLVHGAPYEYHDPQIWSSDKKTATPWDLADLLVVKKDKKVFENTLEKVKLGKLKISSTFPLTDFLIMNDKAVEEGFSKLVPLEGLNGLSLNFESFFRDASVNPKLKAMIAGWIENEKLDQHDPKLHATLNNVQADHDFLIEKNYMKIALLFLNQGHPRKSNEILALYRSLAKEFSGDTALLSKIRDYIINSYANDFRISPTQEEIDFSFEMREAVGFNERFLVRALLSSKTTAQNPEKVKYLAARENMLLRSDVKKNLEVFLAEHRQDGSRQICVKNTVLHGLGTPTP